MAAEWSLPSLPGVSAWPYAQSLSVPRQSALNPEWLDYLDAPSKGVITVSNKFFGWRIDTNKHRPHHDMVKEFKFGDEEILVKVTFRSKEDIQIHLLDEGEVCDARIIEAFKKLIGYTLDSKIYIYTSNNTFEGTVAKFEKLCFGEIMSQNPEGEKCFSCDKILHGKICREVFTSDNQMVYVGPECLKKIKQAGEQGYQPPLGGPRLYFRGQEMSQNPEGEWWIDDSGYSQFADGDIGDQNHEMLAFYSGLGIDEDLLSKWYHKYKVEVDANGIDFQGLGKVFLKENDEEEKIDSLDDDELEKLGYDYLIDEGANKEFLDWYRAQGGAFDFREYALEHMGWIRVHGDNFQLWELNDESLDRMRNFEGWGDDESLEDSEDDVNIEIVSTGKFFSVPVRALLDTSKNAGEILLYSRRSVNPLEISESQRELALDEKASFSVMMSAEAFLKLTTSDNQHFDRIMREALSLGNYNQFSQEGKTLISPLLRINQSGRRGGHITGHEGRHRAAAILHNGETFFPVNIVLLDEVGYSSRKFSILDTPPFWYNQWFLDRPDDPHVEVKYLSAMDNIDSVLDANIQAQYQKNPKIPSGPLNHEEFLAVMKEIEHRVWVEWLDEMEAAKVVSKAPDQWHENPELPLPEKYKFLEVDTVLKRHPDWSPEKAAEFQFKDPEDIARFVSESMVNFGVLDREHFFVIPVDQRHRPTGLYDASIGTATETLVHSRDVLKPVILTNAAAVVFVHNHPTGYLSFSRPDLKLMERLNSVCKEVGIRLLDFMIIGHEGEFKSAVTEGFLVDTQIGGGSGISPNPMGLGSADE